jgi:hypothetical protein
VPARRRTIGPRFRTGVSTSNRAERGQGKPETFDFPGIRAGGGPSSQGEGPSLPRLIGGLRDDEFPDTTGSARALDRL